MKYLVIVLLLALALPAVSQDLTGKWNGMISISGVTLSINVELEEKAGGINGSIDIPMQNAWGLPLSEFHRVDSALSFVLSIGPDNDAIFGGMIYTNDSISGSFMQKEYKGSFYLLRSDEVPEVIPYATEDITIMNNCIKLGGTLSIPEGSGKHPAVVLITGSGPQNRDEAVFGFKVFKVLSDILTRSGIAVLRYDDRGVGESEGGIETSTTRDFASDANAWFDYLTGRDEILSGKIGMLGHSEGSTAAAIAASENSKIAYIVMMAGPAINGKDIILGQQEEIMKIIGRDSAEIANAVELQSRLFDALDKPAKLNSIKDEIIELRFAEYSPEKMKHEDREQKRRELAMTVDAELQAMQTPWYNFLLTYDPADAIKDIECPIIAIFGEKDSQVLPKENAAAFENIMKKAGKNNYSLKTFPDANHLFQKAETGSPMEYGYLKKEFLPGFTDYIISEIKRVLK